MSRIIILFSCFLILFGFSLQAQVTNVGPPKSWHPKNKGEAASILRIMEMPGFDLAERLAEDALLDADKTNPWRFGYEYETNIGLNNGGEWVSLKNGDRLWRAAFHASGALSMSVIFDQFYMPTGATVHLYSLDQKKIYRSIY